MIQNFESFFKEIKAREKLVLQFQQRHASKLATKFNTMRFLRWNENKVSEILGFFLNPNAEHDQGDVYLQLFIKQLGLDFSYANSIDIQVILEETTFENRKVDVVINYKNGTRILGIENKIYTWTADQKGQVRDYLDYLRKSCKSGDYQLLYLAPKSKALTEYSAGVELEKLKQSHKLIIINYEDHIIPLLGEFVKNTENERVRCFLIDFERQLIENYMGKENLDGMSLNNFVIESAENIKTAFSVSNTLNSVKQELEELLHKQMNELAEELTTELGAKVTYSDFNHFDVPFLKNLYVKYNFEESGVIYGLVKKPEYMNLHGNKMYLDNLRDHLGIKFKTSPWWPLYFLQYKNIDHNPEFWIDIVNGTFKVFMKNFIYEILNSSDELKVGL